MWKETVGSLSQEDYQKKVHEARLRDIVEKLQNNDIDISSLSNEEMTEIEKYLKEKDDR